MDYSCEARPMRWGSGLCGRKELILGSVAFCPWQLCSSLWDRQIRWQGWHLVRKASGMVKATLLLSLTPLKPATPFSPAWCGQISTIMWIKCTLHFIYSSKGTCLHGARLPKGNKVMFVSFIRKIPWLWQSGWHVSLHMVANTQMFDLIGVMWQLSFLLFSTMKEAPVSFEEGLEGSCLLDSGWVVNDWEWVLREFSGPCVSFCHLVSCSAWS